MLKEMRLVRRTLSLSVLFVVVFLLPALARAQLGTRQPGETAAYRIRYSNTTTSDLAPLFGMDSSKPSSLAHKIDSEVTGELDATFVQQQGESSLVAFTFRNPVVHVRVNGTDAPESAAIVSAGLTHSILASVTSRGRIERVVFDSTVDETSRSFGRTLLSLIQFVRPASASETNWDATENSQAGAYIARYVVAAGSGNNRTYTKTKLRYLSENQVARKGNVAVTQVITPKGSLSIQATRDNLISLDGTEGQTVTVAGKRIADGTTSVHLQRRNVRRLPASAVNALTAAFRRSGFAPAETLAGNETKERINETISRTELGDRTLESLLAELDAKVKSDDSTNLTALYLKFKALVQLHPEASTTLGKRLITAPANGREMFIIAGALAAVGNEQAQNALGTAIKARRDDWHAMATLVPGLGGVEDPTPSSVDLIMDLAFGSYSHDIASTAQLAAGVMSRSLAVSHPARASAIARRLIAALNAARSTSEKRQFLLVVGNTGSSLALPDVARFASDADASVRATAMSALRWISDANAETILLKGLRSDTDPSVRLASAIALGARDMTRLAFNAQKLALATDASPGVRTAVVANIARARAGFPEAKALLQKATTDSAKSVRDAASSALKVRQ
jgi:hypothetical protein